jgi:uncharacterized protein with von Willebrand factor type A (vWA) domain
MVLEWHSGACLRVLKIAQSHGIMLNGLEDVKALRPYADNPSNIFTMNKLERMFEARGEKTGEGEQVGE